METWFEKIRTEEINENFFSAIGKDWMLITSGTKESFNCMTANSGTIGNLWNKNVVICFIRPTRYTMPFVEKNDYFTLCFFENKYKDILSYCGKNSGRDVNKIQQTGLIPLISEFGNIYYTQSKLVLECRKIYFDNIKPSNFILPELEHNYPKKDYHNIYIGEIINCFKNTLS